MNSFEELESLKLQSYRTLVMPIINLKIKNNFEIKTDFNALKHEIIEKV